MKNPNNTSVFLLFLVASFGLVENAIAHHSSAPHFHRDITVTLDATVTEWKFVNPHAYVYFDVTQESGETNNWRCETSAASGMARNGWTNETFFPGQKLTINGSPAIREEHVCYLNTVTFSDGVEVSRGGALPANYRPKNAQQEVSEDLTNRPAYLENGQPNISGNWVRVRGVGGAQATEEIGLTAAAKAVQEKYEFIYDVPAIHCDIGNIFFGWTHDGHVNQITQYEDRILLQYGYMDYLRTVHLNMDTHPADIVPSRGGHSIGHWEGNTLIVDTIGFLPGYLAFRNVIPHSDGMHSIEKFWYDEATNILLQSYVAEDPAYLNSAYAGQNSMQPSAAAYEKYNCVELSGDNNLRPEDRVGN